MSTELPSQQALMIGRRVRTARERLGMNQSELARKSGATASYLNRLEIGAFGTPSVEKLTNIATALGVKLADLTGEAEPLDEDVAAQIERLEPADRKLVAEAIDEVLRLAPERRREAISWIVASLQAARRVLRLTEARAADVAESLDAALERAAGAEQPAAIRASGTEHGTPD